MTSYATVKDQENFGSTFNKKRHWETQSPTKFVRKNLAKSTRVCALSSGESARRMRKLRAIMIST